MLNKTAHFSLFTLLLLQCCIHPALSDIHCITADSTKPGSTPCATLPQFVADIIHYVHPNSTLLLLPGRHYLTKNLTLSNLDNFSMTSERSTAQIVCTDYSHIFFNNSTCIHITNLEFIGCGGNRVENVQEFVVRDTKFKGEDSSEIALDLVETTAEIVNSTFATNRGKILFALAYKQELRLGGAIIANQSNVNISLCVFINNTGADGGGVLYSESSNVTIEGSEFEHNAAILYGGVLYSENSNIIIEGSEFDNNVADWGGVLDFGSSTITIKASEFDNNNAILSGGVLYSWNSTISMGNCVFANNYSPVGAVIYAESDSTVNQYDALVIANNTANDYAVVYLQGSNFNVHFSGNMMFSNNFGSLGAFNSNVTFIGSIMFADNQPSLSTTGNFREGGAMTLFQSNAFLGGTCSLENNQADNGGAIFSTESKLYVNGHVTIACNSVTRNGGGVYLLNSDLNCRRKSQFMLINNTATHKGGGLHAIGSSISIEAVPVEPWLNLPGTILLFENNKAERGGALSLDSNAKFYILKYHYAITIHLIISYVDTNIVVFTANIADYGGAVYVDDDTSPGTCASDQTTECFFQVLAIYTFNVESFKTQVIHFSNNKAYISGSMLYGGLLDRCAVSRFAEVQMSGVDYEYTRNGVDYFYDVSTIEKQSIIVDALISSRAVQVCLCIDNEHNCTYQNHIEVKKGETFTVSLVAVDQIGRPVNSTIQASLNFTESGIAEGQLARKILGECTNLTFNVISPHNTEALTLYASDGPCKDAGISKKTVTIHFLPCICPVGLQTLSKSDINCTCSCHSVISQYVENCDSHTGSFVRKPQARAWISYINHTNVTGYLVYSNCPFDYCNSSNPPVNLNQPDGADAQCTFNRSSLLCGSCYHDHSLSLGSSRCISCPSYWPALFLTITIAAALAGITLVALLLVLNMSVAVGTLNGLLFYANVVYVHKGTLLPFQESNFLLVFMSWLNLELGIDTCYFPGMDTYAKIWFQLAFPTYIILLVVLVIIISSYSIRLSNLIGKKDPVAILATLILLSYAKLLDISFKSLSVGILEYPDGSHKMLWLPDATVKYLSRKHIPLFIIALFILMVGLVYTALLFSWQWLLLLPSWRIFKWSREPKLHAFIQTYQTPYTSKHRYWTGLLLLARILLYLVAAVNVSNDPHIALLTIIFTVSCIIVLTGSLGRVYSQWPLGMLEILFHWNILLFAAFTSYTINRKNRNQEAVAYTSIVVTFLIFLLIILYHVYTYTTVFSKIKVMKLCRIFNTMVIESYPKRKPKNQGSPLDDIHRSNELLDVIDQPFNNHNYKVTHRQNPAEPTYSVVEVHKAYLSPPDSEDADAQNMTNTAQAVQLKLDEGNQIQRLEIESCIEHKILSKESQV